MARRRPEEKQYNHWLSVWRIWPLLGWTLCKNCGDLVRYEWMWRYSYLVAPTAYTTEYLCSTCAPSRVDAATGFGLKRTYAG